MRCHRDGFSIEAAMAKGRVLPKWFTEEPLILPGDDFYLRAFWDLGTCRQIGMGLGPIPWTAARDYANHSELDGENTKNFLYMLKVMDSSYLDWQQEQDAKKKRARAPKTGGRK